MTGTSRTGTCSDGAPAGKGRPLGPSSFKIKRGPEGAFTLIELVVVIFLISLMAVLVVPNLRRSENRMRAEARKVASILRYANETAASRKVTMPVSFDLDRGTIAWKDMEGERAERVEGLAGVELQSRGMVKEGELVVFFEPLGLKEYLLVHLREGDKERTVAFNPVSGRVRIIEPEE